MSESGDDEVGFVPPSVEELNAAIGKAYEIECLIAAGGMGAVYRATQTALGREVAIKLLPPLSGPYASEMLGRFEEEARIMAQLQHDNVIAIYDFGETNSGLPFLAMEFVKGETLFEIMSRGAVDPSRALEWMSQLCRGLHYVHERQLVHMDIKPSNLMISEADGVLKIADFGLAESGRTRGRDTEERPAWVTPGYTAPECYNAAATPDRRADIYSVGVILYELLTGHLPDVEYVAPSGLVLGLDPRLDDIVEECLRPDPGDRLPNARFLSREIEKLGVRVESRVSTAGPETSRHKERGKPNFAPFLIGLSSVIIAAAMVVVVAVGPLRELRGRNEDMQDELRKADQEIRSMEEQLGRQRHKHEEELRESLKPLIEENARLKHERALEGPGAAKASIEADSARAKLEERLKEVEAERDRLREEFEAYQRKYRVEIRKKAVGTEIAKVTTRSGRIYEQVSIQEISDAFIKVKTADGLASLAFVDLPDSVQSYYAYSPELASREMEEIRKSEELRRVAHSEALERTRMQQRESLLSSNLSRQAELRNRAEILESRKAAIGTGGGIAISRVDQDKARAAIQRDLDSIYSEIQDLEREAAGLRGR